MNEAKKLVSDLRDQNIKLELNGDNIDVISLGVKLTSHQIQRIKEYKVEIIQYLKSLKELTADIPLVLENSDYAISDAQRRLWIVNQFDGVSSAYNIFGSSYFEITNVSNFKLAIDLVIERHEILRTIFKQNTDGEIRQHIISNDEFDWEIEVKDLSDEQHTDQIIKDYILKDQRKAFDFEKGPLFRMNLFQIKGNQYVFYYNMHHIISDGWSMNVLSRDILAFYLALNAEKKANLPVLKIQYKDYANWQLHQLDSSSFKEYKKYWLQKLKESLPVIEFPGMSTRPLNKTYNGKKLQLFLEASLTSNLNLFVKNRDASLFSLLMTVWKVLIYRYTNQTDIIIGTPVSGRDHIDFKDQLGCYVNTIALRSEVKEESFESFFNQVKKETIEAFDNQMYPFDRLVEDLGLIKDTSRNAIFDIMLVMQNIDEHTSEIQNIKENQVEDKGDNYSKFDITVTFTELGDNLFVDMEYNSDLYKKSEMEKILYHFRNLMESAMKTPDLLISKLNFLSDEENKEILIDFNRTQVNYPTTTFFECFDKYSKVSPEKVAVSFNNEEFTYGELTENINQFANFLEKEHALHKGDFIGVKLENTHWMLVTILGIFKAGGVYVPLPPNLPKDRIDFIENDSDVKVSIDHKILVDFIDKKDTFLNVYKSNIELSDLVYVIYTSGSTGMPKGTLIKQGALMNYLRWCESYYLKNLEEISFGLFTPISFDLTITSLFLPLFVGGKLTIFDSKESVEYNLKSYLESDITCIKLTPAHIGIIREIDIVSSNLKIAILGGEALYKNQVELLWDLQPELKIYNEYGPTEATVGCVVSQVVKNQKVTIGKPIANTNVYVVNEQGMIQPKGVLGELLINGVGLAEGYLNKPDLTDQKFIPNPFIEGTRVYKTGDLVKWLDNGTISYVSRKDDQVKIQGHRIELGEIEYYLGEKAEVEEVVVSVFEKDQNKDLVAYVVLNTPQFSNNLRDYLLEYLPVYAIPTFFVEMDTLPLTINGKVNRDQLPSPVENSIGSNTVFELPKNKEEELLVSIWKSVLNREKISIHDNFYNLGGDSIKAIQVTSRLRQNGFKITVSQILTTPILSELSKQFQSLDRLIDQSETKGNIDLTPIQESFFKDPRMLKRNHYNQSICLKTEKELKTSILKQSLSCLVAHHDILRVVFKNDDSGWVQFNKDIASVQIDVDYHDLRGAEDELSVLYKESQNLQSGFDIETGPLFRFGHFRLSDGDRLVLIMHHLVIDGVSWRIILEDLTNLYKMLQENEEPILPLKTDSFQSWASQINRYANGDKIEIEKKYWQEKLNNKLQLLPVDYISSAPIVYDKTISFTLTKENTELLQTKINAVYQTEINDILLCALGIAIETTFGVDKTILKLEGHGREEIFDNIDVSRTVGWFTVVYPFILENSKNDDLCNLIEIKESLRSVPNKGIGYGVLQYLNKDFDFPFSSSIEFNYLGEFVNQKNNNESLLHLSSDHIGGNLDINNGNECQMSISGILIEGQLNMSVSYDSKNYRADTIKSFLGSYQNSLERLIKKLEIQKEKKLTPSDLTYKKLSILELNQINEKGSLEDVYPLSPSQEGLYYHWLMEKSKSLYFIQTSYHLHWPDLDIKKVKFAYEQMITKYAILRTSFRGDYGEQPLQIVYKETSDNFSYEVAPKFRDEESMDNFLQEKKNKDRSKGFNLEELTQMRLLIVELGDDNYEFIWSYHHILMDGWCLTILLNDFYSILQKKTEIVMKPEIYPYSNYIKWLQGVDKTSTLNFWKEYLMNYENSAVIPYANKNKADVFDRKLYLKELKNDVFNKITSFCSQTSITLSVYTQAAWGFLLSKYNQTQDVVFGAVVSGRPAELEGVENMIGLFINTIPIRVKYDNDETPLELLKKIQKEAIESNSHHYVGLSEVQSHSVLGRDLINHILVFENYLIKEIAVNEQQALPSEKREAELYRESNFDFEIAVIPSVNTLLLELQYDGNVYKSKTIEKITNDYIHILTTFIEKPSDSLASINIDFFSESLDDFKNKNRNKLKSIKLK